MKMNGSERKLLECRLHGSRTENGIPGYNSHRGALTVEAALVLPVLLCAFFSVIFIIRAVYAYELVNHAMNETASEIASASYIYHISGIRDIHDTVRNGVNDKADVFREQIGSVFDTYDSISGIKSNLSGGLAGIADSAELLRGAEQNFREVFDNTKNAASDPLGELKSIACYIASGAFNDAKTQLFTPVLKLTMKKYLVTEDIPDADKRLKLLNVEGGLNGLDFSESSFLSDRDENIDIVVRYKIRLPLPVQFIPSIQVVQRVKVKAWMGGDETNNVLHGSNSTDDLWSLSNFQRGLKIRRLFGANLPSNFPVIARFSGGNAVMIKSVDMTASSYQKEENVQKLLDGYIAELAEFKGQEKPWGSGNIIIKGQDIESRELLLVIPQNKLSEANENLLKRMSVKAKSKGISLVIKRYGTKITDSDSDGGTGTESDSEPDATNYPEK